MSGYDRHNTEYERPELELMRKHLAFARQLTADLEELLPPVEVLRRCAAIEQAHWQFEHHVLGVSSKGTNIDQYLYGKEQRMVVLYGFPEPAKAVGGTLCYLLMRSIARSELPPGLAAVGWCFLPVLNVDDQPARGERIEVVDKKPTDRRLEWNTETPAPETTALLGVAHSFRPIATVALHDEFHDAGEDHSAYCASSSVLPEVLCDGVRYGLEHFGQRIYGGLEHPVMGKGFFDMNEAEGFEQSTFARFARFGPVFIPEVSRRPKSPVRDVVAAQLAATLAFLETVAAP